MVRPVVKRAVRSQIGFSDRLLVLRDVTLILNRRFRLYSVVAECDVSCLFADANPSALHLMAFCASFPDDIVYEHQIIGLPVNTNASVTIVFDEIVFKEAMSNTPAQSKLNGKAVCS